MPPTFRSLIIFLLTFISLLFYSSALQPVSAQTCPGGVCKPAPCSSNETPSNSGDCSNFNLVCCTYTPPNNPYCPGGSCRYAPCPFNETFGAGGNCGSYNMVCCVPLPTAIPCPGSCRPPPCLFNETPSGGSCGGATLICCLPPNYPTNTPGAAVIPTPPAMANVLCDNGNGIRTPLGCAPIDGRQLLNLLLRWGVVVASGISILLIAYAGFQIATATGDPKKMKAGQELLVSALAGLVLVALAIVIINFLGKTVLDLPNFKIDKP